MDGDTGQTIKLSYAQSVVETRNIVGEKCLFIRSLFADHRKFFPSLFLSCHCVLAHADRQGRVEWYEGLGCAVVLCASRGA